MHGVVRTDNYYWLNERENPEVIKYLEEENKYTAEILKPYDTFRQHLFNEITGRIKEDDESVPYKFNGYYYYSKYSGKNEHPVYCRKKDNLQSPEEVLLDMNEIAKGTSYCEDGMLAISFNNQWLAYTVDKVGRRMYSLYFKELATGKIVDDKIINTSGTVVWSADHKTVFYTLEDEQTLRPYKIMRHVIGTPTENDVCVFEEKDEKFITDVYNSKSLNYIFIGSFSTLSSEVRYIKSNEPSAEFKMFEPRSEKHEYSVEEVNNEFYIKTNWNAQNFKLMRATPGKTNKESWKEIIPHREHILFEGFEVFEDLMVLEERERGLVHLRITDLEGKNERKIVFDEEDYSVSLSVNEDISAQDVRVEYASLKTPRITYDISLKDLSKKLMKQQEVVGGYDPSLYETKRIYAKARDGAEVPISIVYKKSLRKQGGNPLLLYGYGSYGSNVEPYFVSHILSLLDRGFVYAIAHIRGSETLGRQWYEDGKLLKKKNTFNDFIDCAEYLISQKYTTSKMLYAEGGSAGGLLMGAVVNMRPDLFNGIIAEVPFVDVVTTMLDESIPLTVGEYDEWGNPNEKEYFDYMLSYSPYDNVEKKDYPAMLVTTGLHDSQVQYWEPAKWVAKLRDMKTNDNILLLYTNMDAGHGGASGRFEAYKEVALNYIFLFMQAGIKE